VIRKEAWLFYRTMSCVRLCWELEEPKGPKGRACRPSRLSHFILAHLNRNSCDAPYMGTSLIRTAHPRRTLQQDYA